MDQKKLTCSTWYPHIVPDYSTDHAITSLASKIGRVSAFSSVDGRKLKYVVRILYLYSIIPLILFMTKLLLRSIPIFIYIYYIITTTVRSLVDSS